MTSRHRQSALRGIALAAALAAATASIPLHGQSSAVGSSRAATQPQAVLDAAPQTALKEAASSFSTQSSHGFTDSDRFAAQQVAAELLGCGTDGFEAGPCVERVLTAAVSENGPATAMDALDEYLAEEPDGVVVCHAAAHAAGAATYRRYDRPLRELLHAGGTNCIMGYMHGVLDAYAESHPDPSALISAAESCDWPEAGGQLGQCYDGIGHAAWTSSLDLEVADSVCAALAQAWQRRACEGGIVMQMYAPAYLNASYTLSDDRRELVELCASWPQLATPDGSDPRQGCWESVAYMVSTVVSDRWFAAGSPSVSSDIGTWKDAVREAATTCLQLGQSGAAFCTSALGRYMFSRWSGSALATAVELCRALDEEHVTGCVQEAAAVAATSTTTDDTPDALLLAAGFDEYVTAAP